MILVDRGINPSHPEINSKIRIRGECSSAQDHGTATASLICGNTLSATPNISVDFYPVDNIESSFTQILDSLTDSLEIICLPWSLDTVEKATLDLFEQILTKNVLVIVALGNDGVNSRVKFPANVTHPKIITVGSHDPQFMISLFNSISDTKRADVFAPGRKAKVASGKDVYVEVDGTSYAAALTASAILSYICPTAAETRKLFFDSIQRNTLGWKVPKFANNHTFNIQPIIKVPVPTDSIQLDNLGKLDYSIPAISQSATSRTFSNFQDKITSVLSDIQDEIAVPLSGGLDSEWVAWSLLKADRVFTPAIMRYHANGQFLNTHDFVFAERWCDSNNISPVYFDLDVVDFFGNGKFLEYAKNYYCNSPQLCCHLWLIEQIGKFVILPGDPTSAKNGEQFVLPDLKMYSYDVLFHKRDMKGIARLHLFDEETMELGYEQMQLAQKRTLTEIDGLIGPKFNYHCKEVFYRLSGMDFERRPQKFTGFEQVRQWFSTTHKSANCYFNARFRHTLSDIK